MPSAPLLDLDHLEVATIAVDRAAIYSKLKQAGRFALLDGIVRFDPSDPTIVGFKDIRAGDWWCDDHIPGRPIFPGILMIEAGAHLATWDYMARNPSFAGFLGFGGLNETRFRGQVLPPSRLVFAARAITVRSRAFTYAVQGFVDKKLMFETEVIGVVV